MPDQTGGSDVKGSNPAEPDFYDAEVLRRYETLQGKAGRVKDVEMNSLDAILEQRKKGGERCDSFLDLGTCTGRYLRWAQARGFLKVAGMDHSPHAVRFCREEIGLRNCDLYTADCTDENSFAALSNTDLITMMMGTVHHLTAEGVDQMMTNIADVAREQAQFVVSTWRHTPMDLDLYTLSEAHHLGSIDYSALLRRQSGRYWALQDIQETPSLQVWQFLRL